MRNWFSVGLPGLFILGLLSLSACQPSGEADLVPSRNLTHKERTCSLDDLEANTAGWHRSGAVGGVGLAGNPALFPAFDTFDLSGDIRTAFPETPLLEDVVLLVADDYGRLHNGGASVYTLDASVYELSYSDFPNWAALEAELSVKLANQELSHGAFVLTHTLAVLEEMGAKLLAATADKSEYLLVLDGVRIVVRAVEISGLNTGDIANVFTATAAAYRAVDYSNFVYNMSFTLEPCKSVERFRRKEAPSFDPYLTATPPGIGPGDPLYDLIHKNNRDSLFVAAAGNFGHTQPRQPGRMPNVLSVSSSVGESGQLFIHSNYGEVMLPGIWAPLHDPYHHNGVGAVTSEVLLGGTSLAAPLASAAAVLDLASGQPRCSEAGKNALAHGAFTNRSLPKAVSDYCTN